LETPDYPQLCRRLRSAIKAESSHLAKAASGFNQILRSDMQPYWETSKENHAVRFNQIVIMIRYLSGVITALKRKIG